MTSMIEHETSPTCTCPDCVGVRAFERPRYFSGQLLTESELEGEQSYLLAKSRLRNRSLHGWGVVCGLQVVCHAECKGFVRVLPGYALDPCGNDVVVCEPRDFDVVRAVRKCKDELRRGRRDDCDPLAPEEARCTDADEEWCITLEYVEHESRLTAALRDTSRRACTCGGELAWVSGGNGNGCSCGATKANGYARGNARPRALACEPTRIAETFRLGVARAPTTIVEPDKRDDRTRRELIDVHDSSPRRPDELGGFIGEVMGCAQAIVDRLPPPTIEAGTGAADARKTCCDYLDAVEQALADVPAFTCGARTALAVLDCPPAGSSTDEEYVAKVQEIIAQAQDIIEIALGDCVCLAALPPCPAQPADTRVVLACITVRDDEVIRICHGDERRQLITFPALDYWLGSLAPRASGRRVRRLRRARGATAVPTPFAALLALLTPTLFGRLLEVYCCKGRVPMELLAPDKLVGSWRRFWAGGGAS